MLHIKSLEEGLEIFKALGSNIRVEIIKLLREIEIDSELVNNISNFYN